MGPCTVVGITEVLERDRVGTIRLWLKPMMYVRKIAAKTDGWTEERTGGKIAGWIVGKIGGKTGEKTVERIGGWTGKRIVGTIRGRTQAASSVDWIGRTMWPANMVMMGEIMPG
ncbi:MAG: hypothetical protein A4E19_11045 [Nitrospira sp. SG-bin1]|nr:MAG: hypothetical protein A4E19_11045 [Nitrospira sp. SG-bin1]